MSRETRALTMVGTTVQETSTLPMYGGKSSFNRKQSEAKDFDLKKGGTEKTIPAIERPASARPGVKPAAKAIGNKNNQDSASETATIVIFYITAAIVGAIAIATLVAFPAYQAYVAKINKANELKTSEQERGTEQSEIRKSASANSYTDQELSAIASKANKNLPKMIDKNTRLDSTIGVSEAFQYNYTLVNTNADNLPWDTLRKNLEKSLVNWVCTTEHMLEAFINRGVTVSFAYFGNDKQLIGVIYVQPSQCYSSNIASARIE